MMKRILSAKWFPFAYAVTCGLLLVLSGMFAEWMK